MPSYLITGASRGLGRALVEMLVSRPGNVIIADVPDPSQETSQSLNSLPHGKGSHLIMVKIDSKSETDASEAAVSLAVEHGIERLDVVIANAGICDRYGGLQKVKPSKIREHIGFNALGKRRFAQPHRNIRGSIGHADAFSMVAYGASKAVAHYFTRKLHFECPNITSFALDPGFMQTDMGNAGAQHFGFEQAFVPVIDACKFVVNAIDGATRTEMSGKFVTIDESRKSIGW